MEDVRRFGPATMVVVASLATVLAVSWRAAEEHRGLDLADLRSVVFIAATVFAVAVWLEGGRWPFRWPSGRLSSGSFARFGPSSRAAIVEAQRAAADLQHNYIGTEHLLLGILSAPDSAAARLLRERRVELSSTRTAVEELVGRGTTPVTPEPGFSPRSKRSLEAALRCSRAWGDATIDDRHLLAGLARQADGIAARLLVEGGIDLAELQVRPGGRPRRSRSTPLTEPGLPSCALAGRGRG